MPGRQTPLPIELVLCKTVDLDEVVGIDSGSVEWIMK